MHELVIAQQNEIQMLRQQLESIHIQAYHSTESEMSVEANQLQILSEFDNMDSFPLENNVEMNPRESVQLDDSANLQEIPLSDSFIFQDDLIQRTLLQDSIKESTVSKPFEKSNSQWPESMSSSIIENEMRNNPFFEFSVYASEIKSQPKPPTQSLTHEQDSDSSDEDSDSSDEPAPCVVKEKKMQSTQLRQVPKPWQDIEDDGFLIVNT